MDIDKDKEKNKTKQNKKELRSQKNTQTLANKKKTKIPKKFLTDFSVCVNASKIFPSLYKDYYSSFIAID